MKEQPRGPNPADPVKRQERLEKKKALGNPYPNKILVTGDAMIDRYVFGTAGRVSAEAPVMVVTAELTKELPGGAANVASNIQDLGGVVGTAFSDRELWPIKTRVMQDDCQILRIDFFDWSPEVCIGCFVNLPSMNGIVVADYGKGAITDNTIAHILTNRKDIPVFVNTKRDPLPWLTREKPEPILFCNANEYKNFIDSYDSFNTVVRTHGANGVDIVRYGESVDWGMSIPVNAVSVNGAGDSFMAGFVVKYLETFDEKVAMDYGIRVAAFAVSQPLTTTVRKEDIDEG